MPRRPAVGARDRIVDVAGALFYARGVRAVGMNEVVDAVGCGKNLLYGHFPSKGDLVAAYLERFRAHREAATERAVRECAGDPGAQLVALTAEVAERVSDPRFRGCALRNYLTEFPAADDAASRVARGYLRDAKAQVAGLVEGLDVANPAAVAERVWLIVEGLYATACHGIDRPEAATATALVQEIVAEGCRAA
jgi:AcrR family transcriptional regulator